MGDLPDRDTLFEMYRRMARIRKFEQTAIDLFKRGQVKGSIHSYVGQEASGVGVCMALRRDDLIAGTHRSHGHNIAKGADVGRMLAEILGKETGYCRGRGGSMHIAAFETGSLGALAVVGAGMPIAVGAALGFQLQGVDSVAVPFFGDAASNNGNFHESMNMAAAWKLPIVFALENNRWGVSTRISETTKIEDLSLRALGYGMPALRADGNDVLAVYAAAKEAVARARRGDGPTLLVTEGYRVEGHYAGEPEVYRDRAEVEEHRKNDPIGRFRQVLTAPGLATVGDLDDIDASVAAELAAGVRFAQSSSEPDPSTALDYIYA